MKYSVLFFKFRISVNPNSMTSSFSFVPSDWLSRLAIRSRKGASWVRNPGERG